MTKNPARPRAAGPRCQKRPLDAAGLQRVRDNISAMTPGKATEQRKTMKAMLDHFNKSSVPPNRNKP